MKKITLVYNKQSGSARSLRELKVLFSKYDFSITTAIDITSPAYAAKLKKAKEKKGLIAAIGGDGTISSVAGFVAGSKATLLPLPGGTLNNFTKDCGIPQDIEQALERASKTKARTIDIASVNEENFLNNSSIGLYPQSLTIRENLKGKISKWPAAAYAVIMSFIRFRTYKVTLDGQETFQTPFIFIGNNRYHVNGFAFTNRTTLDEGLLCVYTIKTTSRLAFVKLFFAATIGKLHDADEFSYFSTRSITIETNRRKVVVSHDGEVSKMSSPLHYQSHYKKLRLLG